VSPRGVILIQALLLDFPLKTRYIQMDMNGRKFRELTPKIGCQ